MQQEEAIGYNLLEDSIGFLIPLRSEQCLLGTVLRLS